MNIKNRDIEFLTIINVNWGLHSDTAIKNLPAKKKKKILPAMQETRFQSLGQEGPLEKEMTTHSSILAWKIPWTEEPGGP